MPDVLAGVDERSAMTAAQSVLVLDHLEWAKKIANAFHRRTPWIDLDDFIGAAWLGLVSAATRWSGEGEFNAYAFVCVAGSMRQERKEWMTSHGWVRTKAGSRVMRMEQTTTVVQWPIDDVTGLVGVTDIDSVILAGQRQRALRSLVTSGDWELLLARFSPRPHGGGSPQRGQLTAWAHKYGVPVSTAFGRSQRLMATVQERMETMR